MLVGRKRGKDLHCPAGVRELAGRWYWQPTSKRERDERRAKGLPVSITLGDANTKAAREKWAEVSGYRDIQDGRGTVLELLRLWQLDPKGLKLQPNGEPRADSTVSMYTDAIGALEQRFGTCQYGKTQEEAARGEALGTAAIQLWVDDHPHKGMLKREFAAFDNAFAFGIRKGKTTYNPCEGVALPAGGVREREPLPWEVECLRALASPRLGLQMDFEGIVGWRIGDILTMKRLQGTADGVRVRYKKGGKRWLWEWTPELRRIWSEAEELPFATKFPASPVFPSNRRTVLSYARFDGEWQKLKRRTNAALAAGIMDPGTLEIHAGLTIEDLHFHDLRSKAHDDAEEAEQAGHDFLGNSKAVAKRHYRRREQRAKPLK